MYQKKTSSITIQQVRECLTNMLVNERLQTCKQDEYASYRSTQWIYRTKIARKIAQKKQNPQNK
ncbi:MAG: hypothetical protein LBQ66_14330, partial [Planctomycetaceae bacterium]|jgi:hypothetical protein|nr:hypothetical protein [Planctomycetaceae bacterium]